MKITTLFSFLFIFSSLQSFAQRSENKSNPKTKNIYEVIKDDINLTLEKYGLNGKVKTVEQKTHSLPKDSIINFSNYELIDLNKEHEYSNLAEMDNDCRVTFNENGFLTNRISFGNRFGSKSVVTDALFYDKNNQLIISKNNLLGDDFSFSGDIKFEYTKTGHLIKQHVKKQVWLYSYFEDKNQVKILHHEDNEFWYENLYTYNQLGQKIETLRYKKDKTIESRIVYEYDDQGEIAKEILFNPDGTSQEYYKHKYDQNIKVYQQLDKNQNCITRITINPKYTPTIRIRKIEYYQ
ncbi:hypothetical protein [Flavobacterium hercynium]|uniref:Sugar-binding protein n=1 Tax=Flavobacterium hercynium TaxID=387094 RepID=A0A226GZ42_9FLAO|nr:hypothetical protein [Flavobacterium hercynium]OXA87252.1 hypothetical protein B0A66_16690 [Flavobacterium hercynium]SMP19336.1 hypothetical protein SAMN06265346_10617 [Flavobacterium hercynium]